jgi:hypothetical protein
MTIQNPQDDKAFADSLRDLLRQSEQEVDFVTSARLAAARERALAIPRASQRWPRSWLWIAPGALAAGLAMWMVLPRMQPMPMNAPLPQESAQQSIAMDVLTNDEAIAVYQDLDFYQWLQDTNGTS